MTEYQVDGLKYELENSTNDGLTYEWQAKLAAKQVFDELEAKLTDRQQTFTMPGYRDGKVPLDMIRKQEGEGMLYEIINAKIDLITKDLCKQHSITPALPPVAEMINSPNKTTLFFKVKVEKMPDMPEIEWKELKVTTYKVSASEEDMERAVTEIKDKFRTFTEASEGYKAKRGDAVLIDFHGTINGKDFEGGKAEGVRVEIGSNQPMPGFSEQLIGATKGAKLKVRVMFPRNYNNATLSGKSAVFDVTVREVLIPESVENIDDTFASKLGLGSVEELMALIKEKITADFNGLARLTMKKKLFDLIDSRYRFEIPDGMIKMDFDAMWNEVKAQKQEHPEAFRGKDEKQMMEEYKEIAKRRVRLGLILADIARKNDIQVSEEDLQQAVFAEAMMHPGQESMVMDRYSKKENLEMLKGPILEEKAVDHVLKLVELEEVDITSKEFFEKYAQDLNGLSGENSDA